MKAQQAAAWWVALSLFACAGAPTRPPVATRTAEAAPPPASKEEPPPACRLAQDVPESIAISAKWALRAVAELSPLSDRHIVVNEAAQGALSIYVVNDAMEGTTDANGCPITSPSVAASAKVLDRKSIRGVCEARQSDIRCSERALKELLKGEKPRSPSAGLVFLLAHELAHRALGHVGTHADNVARLDHKSVRSRIEALQRGCERDHTVLEQETAADQLALRAFVQVLQGPPFSPTPDWAPQTVPEGAESAYQAIARLIRWSHEAPEQHPAHSESEHHVCEVMDPKVPLDELPFYGGGHPRRWTRLAAVMKTALDAVGYDESGKQRGDMSGLAGTFKLDQLRALAAERRVADFCADVSAYEAGQLDCSDFTPSVVHSVADDLMRMLPKPAPDLPTQGLRLSSESRGKGASGSYLVAWQLEKHPSFKSADAAKKGQVALSDAVKAELAALGEFCERSGCVVFHEQLSPVGIEVQGSFGQSAVTFEGLLLLRAGADPKTLARRNDGEGFLVRGETWNSAKLAVGLDYRVDKEPARKYRVITKPLPLEEVFDATAARAGKPSQLSGTLRDLARFTRERLSHELGPVTPDQEQPQTVIGDGIVIDAPAGSGWAEGLGGHGPMGSPDGKRSLLTLPRGKQLASSLTLFGDKLAENSSLPMAWDAEIMASNAVSSSSLALAARVESLHAFGSRAETLDDAVAVRVFGPGAGKHKAGSNR
jgi:hypothetical protein